MSDYQRSLEQNALRNVRALVDKLEREDQRAVPAGALWAACGVIVLAVGVGVAWSMRPPADKALQSASDACLVQALAARSSEFRQRIRQEEPGLVPIEIEKRLERDAAALQALAEKDCAAR